MKKTVKNSIYSLIVIMSMVACTNKPSKNIKVVQPLCESFTNPVGIDSPHPRFAWKIKSNQQNQKQTAYQILVATSENSLSEQKADIWNSGIIATSQSQYIKYQGKALTSNQKYYWKLRVWDKNEKPSAWSEPNSFSTGILYPEDWESQWIGAWFPDNYAPDWQYGQWIGTGKENMGEAFYRKSFQIEDFANISKAQLRLSSPGKTKVYINDRLVKNCMHWPGMHEIDLDFFLKTGKNTIAIHAVDKPDNRPDIFGSLMIENINGTQEFIVSDESWKANPITAPAEWFNRFFYDNNWDNAIAVKAQKRGKEPAKGPKSICLRKDFDIKKGVKQALVNITGLGSYQLFINGRKVSKQLLTPGWTEFDVKVEYQTYDVAEYLKK